MTTHALPPEGSIRTPCCGRTLFELPWEDGMPTAFGPAVTCRGETSRSEPSTAPLSAERASEGVAGPSEGGEGL